MQDFIIWTETGRRNGIHAGLKDTGDKIRGIIHPGLGTANDVITFDLSVQPLVSGKVYTSAKSCFISYVANALFTCHDSVGDYTLPWITPYLCDICCIYGLRPYGDVSAAFWATLRSVTFYVVMTAHAY